MSGKFSIVIARSLGEALVYKVDEAIHFYIMDRVASLAMTMYYEKDYITQFIQG